MTLGGTLLYLVTWNATWTPLFSMMFIRRQANRIAHCLARMSRSYACRHVFNFPPTCIDSIIINEMPWSISTIKKISKPNITSNNNAWKMLSSIVMLSRRLYHYLLWTLTRIIIVHYIFPLITLSTLVRLTQHPTHTLIVMSFVIITTHNKNIL